jgi:ribosomal protein S18 acetylase RimI-like enzyme
MSQLPRKTHVTIRAITKADLPAYIDLVQRTSQATYVKPEVGFTRELFSAAVYQQPWLKDYLSARVVPEPGKHVWVAATPTGQLIGTITIVEMGNTCELLGLYVDTAHQGQGIGTRLWQTALTIIGRREVVLNTYTHNPTVAIYKHWGFVEDTSKPHFASQWPGLAPGSTAEGFYLRRPARPAVTIPRTELGTQLHEAAQIKREMTELLSELERTATGHLISKPGAWRHHPASWSDDHNIT